MKTDEKLKSGDQFLEQATQKLNDSYDRAKAAAESRLDLLLQKKGWRELSWGDYLSLPAAIGGIAGLAAGAVSGFVTGRILGPFIIPAITAVSGSQIVTSLLDPAVQAGTIAGLKSTTWLGGLAGAVTGVLINHIPTAGEQRTRETIYKFDGQKIDEGDLSARLGYRPEDFKKVRVHEIETPRKPRVVNYVNEVSKLSAGTAMALTGAFTLAVTGVAIGAAFKMAAVGSKTKDRIKNAARRKDPPSPGPGNEM
jgi:hypothetical protein